MKFLPIIVGLVLLSSCGATQNPKLETFGPIENVDSLRLFECHGPNRTEGIIGVVGAEQSSDSVDYHYNTDSATQPPNKNKADSLKAVHKLI